MLANTQFIENRVYDDDETGEVDEEALAAAEKEAALKAALDPTAIQAKWRAAVAAGMGALQYKYSGDLTEGEDIYNSRR